MTIKRLCRKTAIHAQSVDYIEKKSSYDDANTVSTASITISPASAHVSTTHFPSSPISKGLIVIVIQSTTDNASFETLPICNSSDDQPFDESFFTLKSGKSGNMDATSTPIVDLVPSLATEARLTNSEATTSLNSSISGYRNKALFSAEESEDDYASVLDERSQRNTHLFGSAKQRWDSERDDVSFPIVELFLPNHTSFDHSKSSSGSIQYKHDKNLAFSLEIDVEACSHSCSSGILDDESLIDLIHVTKNALEDYPPTKYLNNGSISKTEDVPSMDDDDGLETELKQLEYLEMQNQHEIDHAIDQIAYGHKSITDWAGEGLFNGLCRGEEGNLCHGNEMDTNPVKSKQQQQSLMDGAVHVLERVCCMDKCTK